tara:strand:- start:270 stop:536 length:267 start_codon:yes stop_codon:yes gene_type:complete
MMNKPFKGISVPYVAPERDRYRSGQFPEVGDLVSKEVAKSPDCFRKVTGVVVSAISAFNMWPKIQWSEFHTGPVAVNPIRINLVSRGQ